jgi:hypothetical protein
VLQHTVTTSCIPLSSDTEVAIIFSLHAWDCLSVPNLNPIGL